MPPHQEVPLARLGLEKSDADGEDGVEDGMDEAQKIRRDTKVWILWKYCSVGGGSIGLAKVSTNGNSDWVGSFVATRA